MPSPRTNILSIVADDLANWALGCYGRDARTEAITGRGQIDIVGCPGVVRAFHGLESHKTLGASYRPSTARHERS